MESVLIASGNLTEAQKLQETISERYNVSIITSPKEFNGQPENSSLILLDHNFTESSGLDFLMEVLKEFYVPVLILTPPDDPKCAIEAMRVGAYNYLVKTKDYYEVLNLSIQESISKFNEREQLKETIVALKNRVNELEERLGIADKEDVQTSPSETSPSETSPSETSPSETSPVEKKDVIIEEIISRFKSGGINLPSPPQISFTFKELLNKGATTQEIADLLQQDVAISSRLISVSNSVVYRGLVESKTMIQAVSRLGISTTTQYVDVISNRSLYITKNKKFVKFIEKLWEHSLSCAYASQIMAKVLKLNLPDDPFTTGLLHDIGKLILLQVIGEMAMKGKFEEEIDRGDFLNTLNEYHGKFGSAILKRWKFSSRYQQIAMYHDDLEGADPISKGLLVVHFANLLVKSMGFDEGQQAEIDLEKVDSFRILKMDSKVIPEVKEQIETLMKEMSKYF